MLGFGAIGVNPVGIGPRGGVTNTVLTASTGSFALTGGAATFTITQAAAVGSFALTGVSASFSISWPNAAGAFALSGIAASFNVSISAAPGAFTINGQPANEIILWPDAPAAFTVTGSDANLVRTGDDYEFKLGGVGHYKLELERAKRLAAITRNPPPPVDLRTRPQFEPLARPPIAPAAPAVDIAAIQKQRMDAAAAAAQAAKKRREIEAILLLAS